MSEKKVVRRRKVRRKKKQKTIDKKIWMIIGGIIAGLVIVYLAISVFFMSHFYINTQINGKNFSGKNAAAVENYIKNQVADYKLTIVEYKPTKPKDVEVREDDRMQVFAQKLCVDFVFGGSCEGVIYYADVKKRFDLHLQENFAVYDAKLKTILEEMRGYLNAGKIPAIRKGQKCSGCSMKDLCMPNIKQVKSIQSEIEKIGRTAL